MLGYSPLSSGYYGIRSTSGWYASYWNAYLLILKFDLDMTLTLRYLGFRVIFSGMQVLFNPSCETIHLGQKLIDRPTHTHYQVDPTLLCGWHKFIYRLDLIQNFKEVNWYRRHFCVGVAKSFLVEEPHPLQIVHELTKPRNIGLIYSNLIGTMGIVCVCGGGGEISRQSYYEQLKY